MSVAIRTWPTSPNTLTSGQRDVQPCARHRVRPTSMAQDILQGERAGVAIDSGPGRVGPRGLPLPIPLMFFNHSGCSSATRSGPTCRQGQARRAPLAVPQPDVLQPLGMFLNHLWLKARNPGSHTEAQLSVKARTRVRLLPEICQPVGQPVVGSPNRDRAPLLGKPGSRPFAWSAKGPTLSNGRSSCPPPSAL